MGSIASVLQWHCDTCSFINPTERLTCISCGEVRKTRNEKMNSDKNRICKADSNPEAAKAEIDCLFSNITQHVVS